VLGLYAGGNDEKISLQEYLKAQASFQLFWSTHREEDWATGKLIDAALYILLIYVRQSLESPEEHCCNHGAVFDSYFRRL
jgi:hypothetical protein